MVYINFFSSPTKPGTILTHPCLISGDLLCLKLCTAELILHSFVNSKMCWLDEDRKWITFLEGIVREDCHETWDGKLQIHHTNFITFEKRPNKIDYVTSLLIDPHLKTNVCAWWQMFTSIQEKPAEIFFSTFVFFHLVLIWCIFVDYFVKLI